MVTIIMNSIRSGSFSLFIPVIFICFFQAISLFLFDWFEPKAQYVDKLFVLFLYLSVVLSILCCSYLYDKWNLLDKEPISIGLNNGYILSLVLILSFIFVFITVKINIYAYVVGFDRIRDEFFLNQEFRASLFGGMFFDWVFNIFLIPFSWLFVIYLGYTTEYKKWFYGLLLIISLYNISIAGRFSIYYAFNILVIRFTYFNGFKFKFLIKLIMLVLIIVLLSSLILTLRDDNISFTESINSLIDYHIIPPFFLINKMQEGFGYPSFSNIPFYTVFSSFLLSIMKLIGAYQGDVPYYYFATYLNDFTLYSELTKSDYNAFSTVFPFFIVEYSFLAPLFVFLFFSILFLSCIFVEYKYRKVYITFLILYVYFSFFKYEIASPGFQFFVVFILLYSLTKRVVQKI